MRIQRADGTGVWNTLKNHKNFGFLSNTGHDPQICQASRHQRHASETPFNGVSLAGQWWPAIVVFGSYLPSSTKKIIKKTVVRVGLTLTKNRCQSWTHRLIKKSLSELYRLWQKNKRCQSWTHSDKKDRCCWTHSDKKERCQNWIYSDKTFWIRACLEVYSCVQCTKYETYANDTYRSFDAL